MRLYIIRFMSMLANLDIFLMNEREKILQRREYLRKDWTCDEKRNSNNQDS